MPGADAVIGERAFGGDPELVAALGREVVDGFLEVGLMPVMKHIPGHGRATEDSHKTRPVVTADAATLDATDFLPFARLRDTPWAMVSHVVYSAFDPDRPASVSPVITQEVIRGRLGFEGVLISDCVFMNSLQGEVHDRVAQVLDGGCDIALHCHGELPEMQARRRPGPAAGRRRGRPAGRGGTPPGHRPGRCPALHAEVEALLAAA